MPLLGSLAAGSVKGFGAQANLGYFLGQSLRFRRSASAYLTRTPTTAGNRRTFTYSGWIKRGLSGNNNFFSVNQNSSYGLFSLQFDLNSGGDLGVYQNTAGTGTILNVSTNSRLRDHSAWYHIVVAVDTTQATASNRVKIYVNGILQSVTIATQVAQNTELHVNNTLAHNIGKEQTASGGSNNYFDGYMGDVYFVDGQALTPSDFGKTDPSTGSWIPKKYSGTYGTNGFYLNFRDGTSTTTLGYDQSPNDNNWTTNNISLTAGTTYDLMNDVPTLTSEDKSNYPVCNILRGDDFNATYSNGNMTATLGSSSVTGMGTANWHIPTTGKWFWEVTIGNFSQWCALGIRKANATLSDWLGYTANDYSISQPGITKHNDTTYDASYTNTNIASGDVFGVAFDADNGTLKFYQNGADLGTAFTGLTDEYVPAFSGSSSVTQTLNFGQQPFKYSIPAGYKKLNTYNL